MNSVYTIVTKCFIYVLQSGGSDDKQSASTMEKISLISRLKDPLEKGNKPRLYQSIPWDGEDWQATVRQSHKVGHALSDFHSLLH